MRTSSALYPASTRGMAAMQGLRITPSDTEAWKNDTDVCWLVIDGDGRLKRVQGLARQVPKLGKGGQPPEQSQA